MILNQENVPPETPQGRTCPSILAVIVLYRMSPFQSPGFRSLLESSKALAPGDLRLKILVYDNAPERTPTFTLPDHVDYFPAPQNDGIAGAYNYALRIAEVEAFGWLLTLDQDTTLPPQILARLAALTKTLEKNERVAAIVPQLVEGAKPISPAYVGHWRPSNLPLGFTGIPDREITAFNSATTWRVQHLLEIGGFDKRFWLDCLDHVLHNRTFRAGKQIYIAGDIKAEHELSLRRISKGMTPARLENILLAESAFMDLYKSPVERALFTLRLVKQCCGRLLRREDLRLVQKTLMVAVRQLLRTRRRRLKQWEESLNDQH
ncbi:MAG: glycosyltransferase [Terracidiphilus sp.]